MSMTHLNDIKLLRSAGYMVFHIEPLTWRVRGEDGYIDMWLIQKRYKRQYGSELHEYDDALLTVMQHVQPCVYALTTSEEKEVFAFWRRAVDAVMAQLGDRRLST